MIADWLFLLSFAVFLAAFTATIYGLAILVEHRRRRK